MAAGSTPIPTPMFGSKSCGSGIGGKADHALAREIRQSRSKAKRAGARVMPASLEHSDSMGAFMLPFGMFAPAMEYMFDAAQRTVLFWDVMRQRGNQYREHLAKTAPHVLEYEVELISDGRALERPVNYGLVRVVPPKGVQIDPFPRPFVLVVQLAGQGPGIGC